MEDKVLSSGIHHSCIPQSYIRPESERPRLSQSSESGSGLQVLWLLPGNQSWSEFGGGEENVGGGVRVLRVAGGGEDEAVLGGSVKDGEAVRPVSTSTRRRFTVGGTTSGFFVTLPHSKKRKGKLEAATVAVRNSGVEVRVIPMHTEIIIRDTRTRIYLVRRGGESGN
ncbi:hypothetical protein K1719_018176 [Acacia pycnantha]|nr:hypothetical protein K1719_018176 [Acacia pycnantha]